MRYSKRELLEISADLMIKRINQLEEINRVLADRNEDLRLEAELISKEKQDIECELNAEKSYELPDSPTMQNLIDAAGPSLNGGAYKIVEQVRELRRFYDENNKHG